MMERGGGGVESEWVKNDGGYEGWKRVREGRGVATVVVKFHRRVELGPIKII